MNIPAVLLMIAVAGSGQEQQTSIQDLSSLVDKQVTAQRMPLCQPGTYTYLLTYAGKQAKVISLKPANMAHLSEGTLSKLPPEARSMMEDQRKAATILVQFDDGTQLDSCGPVAPSKLSEYFELAPGQTLQPVAQPTTTDQATSAPVAPIADALSVEEVKLAVTGNGRSHWVFIQDAGLLAAQGNQVPAITLFMPDAVLAIRAESAKKQFTQYVPSEEDERRSLMIVAQGYAGITIAEGCTSITRIVLLSDPRGG